MTFLVVFALLRVFCTTSILLGFMLVTLLSSIFVFFPRLNSIKSEFLQLNSNFLEFFEPLKNFKNLNSMIFPEFSGFLPYIYFFCFWGRLTSQVAPLALVIHAKEASSCPRQGDFASQAWLVSQESTSNGSPGVGVPRQGDICTGTPRRQRFLGVAGQSCFKKEMLPWR